MSELEERLNAVLSDPEQMSRIAQMASKLMGSIAPGGTENATAAPAAPAAPDAAWMGLVSRIVGSMNGNDRKKQLLQGLSPYLAQERRRRLERALRLAAAARLAGAAFAELGGDGAEPL